MVAVKLFAVQRRAVKKRRPFIDIGADEIVVAVPPDRDPKPVRAFGTFTPDLLALVAWLLACGID